ncbi:hypothetical protein U0033_26620 [Chitinophaga sancti]|uniref:Phage portal protein n=2 Tax=Chitinophaga sancti TaxID=1004 RepID=A0ABZ0XS14_9BACT|nr:hypothetical protein [Chitinophaga sancti]WQD61455.1 hypothetical protein U0033_26620 [Chitinophaga sancti]WQG92988.1 hypothetical protein SR876_15820 [Chitinophaga sancti]
MRTKREVQIKPQSTNKKEVLNFTYNIPSPTEDKFVSDDRQVNYGLDNNYPAFLLKLYADSPINQAIINAKGTYIFGDGLKYVSGNEVNINVNPSDSFNEFINKCIKDYLLFNYFCVEVTYNSFGEPVEYHHCPAQNIRTNRIKNKFWYSEDWKFKKSDIVFDRFTPTNSEGNSKLFFFDGYFPSNNNTYPLPEYSGCIKSILTDIAIRSFNLNNIKSHFSVSTLITFFMGGNVDEEVKRQILKDIKDSYSGETGEKIILDFQSLEGKPAEVKNISPNEWDKAYSAVSTQVQNDILIGHSINNPMLMGIKTEGQLGGATELETAYQIFKNTYIRNKIAELTSAFNQLFANSTLVTDNLSFTDKPLFETQLADATREKIFTINELRAIAGMKPIQNGDRLLADPVPNNTFNTPQPEEEIKKKSDWVKHSLQPEDFEKIKHLGNHKGEFEIVKHGKFVFNAEDARQKELQFNNQSDIAQWALDNDISNLTLDEIKDLLKEQKDIDITTPDLEDTLNELSKAGIIQVETNDKGRISIKPDKVADLPDTGTILTMYDYVKRPEADGDILIPTSRGFCIKLVENNKYYSREDIQTMSGIFGYDVFTHCGGFWKHAGTDSTKVHCRHKFQQVMLKRKNTTNG